MVKVKICGITNLEDAQAAVRAGCDALGFVFYKKSPRYITACEAKKIIEQLPKRIKKIGVFVDTSEKNIKNTARLCRLDMLQFHGNQSPHFCARFKGYKIIKALRIKNSLDLKNILKYSVFAYLFDTFSPRKFGGTGKSFNWRLLNGVKNNKKNIFLSGGLNAKNVKKAIKLLEPDWVDVSSSVELRPGKKDQQKIKVFMRRLRG